MIHAHHPLLSDLLHVEQSMSAIRLEEMPILVAVVPLAEPNAQPSEPMFLPTLRTHESPRPLFRG